MGRTNIPPVVSSLVQPEPPSTSVASESNLDANLTSNLASTLSPEDPPSLVSVESDSNQDIVHSSPSTDEVVPLRHTDRIKPNESHSRQLASDGGSHTFDSTPNPTGARALGLAAAPLQDSQVDSQIPSVFTHVHKALRGASAPLASLAGPSAISPLARTGHALPSTTTAQRPSKRAVVVGINYNGPNHDSNRRLRYGVNDARCVASSLRMRGFPDGAVIVLTDEKDQEECKQATHGKLISWTDWLVKDARAGDSLVFFFSGHSNPEDSSLVMADGERFNRDLLRDQLILAVPAGCHLHIMLDCCSASSIIELQYCIGKMLPKPCFTTTSETSIPQFALLNPSVPMIPPSTRSTAGPSNQMAFAATLSGTAFANNVYVGQVPVRSDPRPSVHGSNIGLYRGNVRRGASAVAALPLLHSAQTHAPRLARSAPLVFSGVGQASTGPSVAPPQLAVAQGPPRGRQAPVQTGHIQDYFSERPGQFTKPAGTVILWASSGPSQSTFEAYNGRDVRNGAKVRNGIVPNAICTALSAFAGSELSVRDLWYQIVSQVEEENDWRRERDATKPWNPRLLPLFREQCAELWISQPEPLSTAGPALDRPVFLA